MIIDSFYAGDSYHSIQIDEQAKTDLISICMIGEDGGTTIDAAVMSVEKNSNNAIRNTTIRCR